MLLPIKFKSFRKLSRKYHPDLHPGDESARQKFLELNQAYDVLQNSDTRRKYDIYGADFNKIEQHFQRQQKPDLKMYLWVNLEDLYSSKIYKFSMKKLMFCPNCRGSGAQSPKDIHICSACQGKGQVFSRRQVMPGFFTQVMDTCSECEGKGRYVRNVCRTCKGQKLQWGYEENEFLVEKGMPEGYELVLKEQSDESLDNIAQNYIFIIKTMPHATMTRKDDDLHTSFNIDLKEALLGFQKEFTHLDGHKVKISRDKVSQHGDIIKISNEGMPKHKTPSEFGDLYVTLKLTLPNALSAKQKSLLWEIF